MSTLRFISVLLAVLLVAPAAAVRHAHAQAPTQQDAGVDDVLDEGLFEDARETEPGAPPVDLPSVIPPESAPGGDLPGAAIEGGAPREGENRWNVVMTIAVVMNYVFDNSPDSFVVKYQFVINGQANAETAVLRGDADITASVAGPLSKWPTGECKLSVTIPKVPYELTFRKTADDKGNLKLVFRKSINEDWQSQCTFGDAPGARFETRGAPEAWLSKALEKARPPIKDIIADLGPEETTSRFVISKESIPDPPLGSAEIEGTGVITIRPGGQ